MPVLRAKAPPLVLDHRSNGILLTPQEFDRADFEEGWRYELIQGVLIVTPLPFRAESSPNQELGHWLLSYQETHAKGGALDGTLYEQTVNVGRNRRRADRVIWTGLGHIPRRGDKPTILVEFASKRKRDRDRDYRTKRAEYLRIGVKEYWVIDRLTRTLTVFGKNRKQVVEENQVYRSDLLPGFELPLKKLLKVADAWEDETEEEEILE